MKFNKGFVFVAAALAAQIVAIGSLVWRYERVVSSGVEFRLKCQAYDPYDPLRGRYLQATVREDVTNILFEIEKGDVHWRNKNNRLFVKISETPGSDGFCRVEAVAKEPTDDGLWVKPDRVRFEFLLGWPDRHKDESYDDFHVRQEASGIKAVVSFPNRLFMNEHLAPKAEELLRSKSENAVAIYRAMPGGAAIITDIEINGISIGEEVK